MASVFRLMLSVQLTRGRAAALITVAVIGMLLGVAVGNANLTDPALAAFRLVDGYMLGLLVPVTALVFASSSFGDPVEDATLVYLWLRPIARWKLVAASFAAAICVSVPFAVVPAIVTAGLTRTGRDLPVAALVGSIIATVGYCALFLGLGLLVRRALVWGLAYVLIWEGFVARSGTAAARLSILLYGRSLMAHLSDHAPPRLASSTPVALIVPLAVAAVALALTTWALRTVDVK